MAFNTKHEDIVASVAEDITLTGVGTHVELVAHGAEPVYFRADGTTATVKGTGTAVCLPGGFKRINVVPDDSTVVVSVISASSQLVSVELLDRAAE